MTTFLDNLEMYPESCQMFTIELFAKIINNLQLLIDV